MIASASTGGADPVQRSGSVVAPRMPSIARSTAIAFAPFALGVARRLGAAHAHDDRDPVAFGDALAQTS